MRIPLKDLSCLFFKRKRTPTMEKYTRLSAVEEAKKAWWAANAYFQEVTEPALIDLAIEQMEQAEKRLMILIKEDGWRDGLG